MTYFYLETYGCSSNFADSERMAGLLEEAKFVKVEQLEEADIIIFNTCTVKSPTANSFFNRLKEIKKENPYKIIVIAGCIAQTEPKKLKGFALIGPKQIHNIVPVVEEALNDNKVQMLDREELPPLNLPKVRKNKIVEIIPLSLGCLNACAFCKTKHARGNLQSYPQEEIVKLAKKAVREGIKEIWLTSQDTMCYGFDMKTDLPTLLQEIVNIPGDFKIRIGMGNPEHLIKIIDQLIPLLQHEKVFKFVHLPIQSGNNEILKKMKRNNTMEEFKKMIQRLKKEVPKITIATDIIVGFPTETEEQYWDTINLLRELTPDVVNISKFWPRPKTSAAEMKQVPVDVIKHRAKVMMEIFQNISRMQNEKLIGWEGTIVIDEPGKESLQWVGRNEFYKPVIVTGDYKIGDVLKVKIMKSGIFDLRGKVVG